jgi:hypothetical protein
MVNLCYEFIYDNKRRIVVITSEDTHRVMGWSFTDDGYRSFNKSKMGEPTLLMDKVKVLDYDEDLAERYEEAGCSVFLNDEVMYVVRLKND